MRNIYRSPGRRSCSEATIDRLLHTAVIPLAALTAWQSFFWALPDAGSSNPGAARVVQPRSRMVSADFFSLLGTPTTSIPLSRVGTSITTYYIAAVVNGSGAETSYSNRHANVPSPSLRILYYVNSRSKDWSRSRDRTGSYGNRYGSSSCELS
jgi:hypothetical protein